MIDYSSDGPRRAQSIAGRHCMAAGIALALALVTRVGYILSTPGYVPVLDAEDFSRLGARLAAGVGFGISRYAPGGGPTAYRPPLYPLFLGAVYRIAGVNFTSARLAQAVLGTITVALIGAVAFRLWGARVSMVALLLAAVYPPLITSTAVLLSEGLGVLFEMAAVAAILEYRRSHGPAWLIAAGAAVGAATLTRPNYLVLLLPLAMLAWSSTSKRRRVLAAVAVAVTTVLVIAPWTTRNILVMHRDVVLTTQTGYLLAGTYNDAARRDSTFPATWRSPAQVGETAALYLDRSLKEADMDRVQTQAALRYLGSHPTYPVEVAFWNTAYVLGFNLDLIKLNTMGELGLGHSTALVTAGLLYVVEVLAVAGAFTLRARQGHLWFWAIPVVMLATTILVQGAPRFRLPVDPFLLALASLAVVTLADRLVPMPDGPPAKSLERVP
jgi:4-amino-4-deoxy-L-arabinose transferase-like glycosyltransferase